MASSELPALSQATLADGTIVYVVTDPGGGGEADEKSTLSALATFLAGRAAFTGTYVAAFMVDDPTGVAATDTTAIQTQLDAASTAGGGRVVLQWGTYVTTGLTLPAHVTIEGAGPKATVIQLAASADTSVITSEDFATLTGSNDWFVSDGVPVGLEVRNLRIDGNKANNTAGHGLCLYAKRFTVSNVLIHDCSEDGIYTECGDQGTQPAVDDIPECQIGPVWIKTCDGNGITYRGPHDGHLDRLFIAGCENGFVSETSAGVYNGACDIGFAHIYGNLTDGVQLLTSCRFTSLTTEQNFERGLYVGPNAGNSLIGLLYAYSNQRQFESAGTPTHSDYSVQIGSQAVVVSRARIRATYGGCALRIQANDCQVSANIRGHNSAGLGLDYDASGGIIQAVIYEFDASGGEGAHFCRAANRSGITADLSIGDCDTGITNTNKVNESIIRATINAGAGQTADGLTSDFLLSDSDLTLTCDGAGSTLTKKHTTQLEQQFNGAFNLQGASSTGLLLIPDFPVTSGAVWSATYNTGRWFNIDTFQGTAGDGDYCEIPLLLRAGTYTLVMWGRDGNNCGIVQPKLDGSNFGASQDLYAASTNRQRYTRTGLTVSTSGVRTFRLEVAGQNASSSGFFMTIVGVELIRTGA